jgi:uncharacterized protein YqeY
MVKTAIKHREVEKMRQLDDTETMQVLSTLIKQREDSVQQFTAGGRLELAEKERAEIRIIEGYLPKALSAEDIEKTVRAVVAEIGAKTQKDMGNVMKAAMARFQSSGQRVDGKVVSDTARKLLT